MNTTPSQFTSKNKASKRRRSEEPTSPRNEESPRGRNEKPTSRRNEESPRGRNEEPTSRRNEEATSPRNEATNIDSHNNTVQVQALLSKYARHMKHFVGKVKSKMGNKQSSTRFVFDRMNSWQKSYD